MKTNILIFAFFCLSVIFVFTNYKKLLSSQIQVIFHKDLVEGSYSFNIDQLKEYDFDFPSLSFNMIPIKTYLSRYYLNQKKYDDAINNINAAIKKNPFSVYSFYLKARIYLDMGQQNEALNYLERSYLMSNSTDYVAALYFTLLSENKNYRKLLSNYINVENSLNKNIWLYYLSAINSVDTSSYDSLILKINNRYNYLNEKNKLKN